jgi:hypothetical protein
MQSGYITSKLLEYLENPEKKVNKALLEEAAKRLTSAISRQLMEQRQNQKKLRMSSGGQCMKKQWYAFKGEEGEPISGRTLNTFLNGDTIEVNLSIIGRLAGLQLMGKPDGEDEIHIAAMPDVKGHCDDVLYMPDENRYYLVEYKSMSDYSYRKFEKDGLDDEWGYFTQASLYCEALGIEEFILVAQCKSTGHICDRVYRKDPNLVRIALEKWNAIKSNPDVMPNRGYEPEAETKYNRSTKVYDPTGRSILGIQCSYCSFRAQCWPEVQQEFKGEKPIWIVPSPQPMAI